MHPELAGAHPERRNWLAAMAALGMSGDPTGRELVARLKELRDGFESGVLPPERVERDSAIIYKALAAPLGDSTARSDLSDAELRKAFQDGDGLLFADSRWWKPDQVFAGLPVFGGVRGFRAASIRNGTTVAGASTQGAIIVGLHQGPAPHCQATTDTRYRR